ncbi:hypothetical protein ACQP2F_33970 [Actinoplanes sp. CA-030573]|uniref:hypothetical protein n=1 Tax=Actinoplanes sp. CA-030573 TaxID=3239898 RepID=UPI003D9393A6
MRSELYRMASIRSSWISIALFGAVAAAFGILDPNFWALMAGVGAFGIGVLTITQHFQNRTTALLFLARPRRFPVLFAQIATTVLVALGLTALSGITVLLKDGSDVYAHTLLVIPIMAVFGASLAAVVRRASWLLFGFTAWFVVVEGIVGRLEWHLPMSSYLNASGGDQFALEVFAAWALGTLAVAAVTLRRDLAGD